MGPDCGECGGLVAAAPLALLVEAVGWRLSFVMIGLITVLLAVAAILFISDRPEALGLAPINPARRAAGSPSLRETLRGIPGVMANPRTWPPVLAAIGV